VLIEKLLQFFVDKIDTNLFETIVVENLESSNIEASDIISFLHCWVNKGKITLFSDESENQLIDLTANTTD